MVNEILPDGEVVAEFYTLSLSLLCRQLPRQREPRAQAELAFMWAVSAFRVDRCRDIRKGSASALREKLSFSTSYCVSREKFCFMQVCAVVHTCIFIDKILFLVYNLPVNCF